MQNFYPSYQQPQMRPMQQPQQMPMQLGLKGRPVSSLDEVRATTIDFDGSIFFFPDLANKRIYTKQINMDGTASLNVYELKNIPIEVSAGNFVTREEFNDVIAQLKLLMTPTTSNGQTDNIASQF